MKWQPAFSLTCALLFQAACSMPAKVDTRQVLLREHGDSRLDSYLQDMATNEHFTGVVLVMREGKTLLAKGYGAATDIRPNGVDTRIHVGSITKEFTAAAVMQLAEKGMLRLDGPINNYLPQKYRSAKWNAVTVHQLLSHTSGIPDYAVARDYYQVVNGFCSDDTVDGMLQEAMGKDLEFAPGSKYAYTNLGYTLLGVIIESRTNTPYAEYIRDKILEPMGMTSSTIHVFGRIPSEEEAAGRRWSDERGRHVPDELPSLPATAPDGGLITTAEDFARWSRIFAGEKQTILSESSIELMSSPQIRIGNGGPLDSMGYGLFVGDRLIGHGGLIAGFSSQFVFDRESRSLVAVLSNDAASDPQRIVFGLLTILLAPDS